MKFTDFNDIFGERKASVALLSTYDFDPLFFEHRLLWSDALAEARRIMIFMDAGCYRKMARSEVHARYLNERYLVVPTASREGGVFHAKLHLLLNKNGATLFCGSNNLTQAGCTNNLEFINAVEITKDENDPRRTLLSQALGFFRACFPLCTGPSRTLVQGWLDELMLEMPWLPDDMAGSSEINLVHSLSGTIWEKVQAEIGTSEVKRILVISPFYDQDLAFLKEIRDRWPHSPVEIVAQEQTSNLPARKLTRFGAGVRLFGVKVANSRRLHAKLVAAYSNESGHLFQFKADTHSN